MDFFRILSLRNVERYSRLMKEIYYVRFLTKCMLLPIRNNPILIYSAILWTPSYFAGSCGNIYYSVAH